MTLDHLLVGTAIVAALAFLSRGFFVKKKPGCGTGCGCDPAKKPGPR